MSADFEHLSHEGDPLEDTELVRRLRRMEWPPAPPEVKERVLRQIVARRDEDPDDGAGPPSEPAG